MSGQSIFEVGSLVELGFSKQPSFSPKAAWLHSLYSGLAKMCLTKAQESSKVMKLDNLLKHFFADEHEWILVSDARVRRPKSLSLTP